MSISEFRRRRLQQERLSAAGQELAALRGQLADAYGLFNRTADPALLEASILEISALQMRCDRLLRSIKDLNGELQHDTCDHPAAGHRRGIHLPDVQAAEKTDQMGV